jgi:hypothetical protein
MTLQELKENREIIIETITDALDASMVSEVMAQMVKMLGFNGIESTNVVDYTIEVIELCQIKIKMPEFKNTLWGNGCKYSTQAEYQRACLNQRVTLTV